MLDRFIIEDLLPSQKQDLSEREDMDVCLECLVHLKEVATKKRNTLDGYTKEELKNYLPELNPGLGFKDYYIIKAFKGKCPQYEEPTIINKLENCFQRMQNLNHLHFFFASEGYYRLLPEGEKFFVDGKTYAGEFKNSLKNQRKSDFYSKFDKANRVLAPILGVITVILTLATTYLTYASIQQNKDIEQLNKDRDELKAENKELRERMKVLEKDYQQRQIESKLKLPIRK